MLCCAVIKADALHASMHLTAVTMREGRPIPQPQGVEQSGAVLELDPF